MQITESFTLSKTGRQDNNEDMLFINQRFIAVVDGVTAKTAAPEGAAVSGGRFAAQAICTFLSETDISADPLQMITCFNNKLKEAVAGSVFASQPEPPAASIILYDDYSHQVISYGDCQILHKEKNYKREKLLDRLCATKRARVLHECLQNGQTAQSLLNCDVGRKAIEADILGSFLKYANKTGEYGFPVLGTGNVVADYIDVYPIQCGDEVVLASDGYPHLLPTLSDSEQALTKILQEDPLLIRQYLSTKGVYAGNVSYDDRTYIRFTVQ